MLSHRKLIRRVGVRVAFWCSRWEAYEGIQIGVLRICESPEQTTARIRSALDLIRTTSPLRFGRLRREMRRVWVFPIPYNLAEWHHRHSMCVLNPDFVQSSLTTISQLAATLIHEGTHGRLERLGFAYREDRRVALERVCFMEEIRFARRLPDGEEIIRVARSQMARPSSDWTTESMDEARLDSLRQTNCPRWLLRIVERSVRSRDAA
jgi:hypothetical protein